LAVAGNRRQSARDVQPFFQAAQGIAAPYIKAGKWHTFSGSEAIVDGVQLVSLHGHTPGHTGYEFSSKGQKILFWGDTVHAQIVQLRHPDITVVFDNDHAAAAVTRNQLLPTLAREGVHDRGTAHAISWHGPPAQGGEWLCLGAGDIQRFNGPSDRDHPELHHQDDGAAARHAKTPGRARSRSGSIAYYAFFEMGELA